MVITGDFFQLPPVTRKNERTTFAFESPAWTRAIKHTVELQQVWRQRDNRSCSFPFLFLFSHLYILRLVFVESLNRMRKGERLLPQQLARFRNLARPLPPSDILPTELFPIRIEVQLANSQRLAKLEGDQHTYTAVDSFPNIPAYDAKELRYRQSLLEQHSVFEPELHLKPGAQVMLLKNAPGEGGSGLVNGTVGQVVGFYRAQDLLGQLSENVPLMRSVKMEPDRKAPLNLQPQSLPSPTSSPTQVTRSPSPIPATRKTYGPFDDAYLPLVDFLMFTARPGQPTSERREAVLVAPDDFRIEDPTGQTIARRFQVRLCYSPDDHIFKISSQLPLTLAWAMSIHKSQGQSLLRLKVDLARVFERGQSYVALSRATSLDGLQVLNFDPRKVVAHPRVLDWSRKNFSVPSAPSSS